MHDYETEAFLLLLLKNCGAIIPNIWWTFIYPKEQVHSFSTAVSNSSLPLPHSPALASLHVNLCWRGRKDNQIEYPMITAIHLKCLNKIPYVHVNPLFAHVGKYSDYLYRTVVKFCFPESIHKETHRKRNQKNYPWYSNSRAIAELRTEDGSPPGLFYFILSAHYPLPSKDNTQPFLESSSFFRLCFFWSCSGDNNIIRIWGEGQT